MDGWLLFVRFVNIYIKTWWEEKTYYVVCPGTAGIAGRLFDEWRGTYRKEVKKHSDMLWRSFVPIV